MHKELDTLEAKLKQLIQLTSRLRAENHNLRQDLAEMRSRNRQLEDRIDEASTRVERLIGSLSDEPEEEEA